MHDEVLLQQVRDCLNESVDLRAIKSLDDNKNLFELGLLDSLSIIQVILNLEKKLNINFKYSDIQIDNFRSINTIASAVSRIRLVQK